jgi:hypothetical protein
MVAESAAPGDSELLDVLDCMPGPGEADLPSGEVPIAEGGGDEPSIEDRNPRDSGLARMVEVVGTRGEGGARLELVGMGELAPRIGGFELSRDPSAPLIVGLDEAELKLDTDPLCPLPLRLRPGVLRLLLLLTSIGDGGDDDEFESICVALRLSARSLADSSFDLVRPIFLDGC